MCSRYNLKGLKKVLAYLTLLGAAIVIAAAQPSRPVKVPLNLVCSVLADSGRIDSIRIAVPVYNERGERVAVVVSRLYLTVDSVANDTLYGHTKN